MCTSILLWLNVAGCLMRHCNCTLSKQCSFHLTQAKLLSHKKPVLKGKHVTYPFYNIPERHNVQCGPSTIGASTMWESTIWEMCNMGKYKGGRVQCGKYAMWESTLWGKVQYGKCTLWFMYIQCVEFTVWECTMTEMCDVRKYNGRQVKWWKCKVWEVYTVTNVQWGQVQYGNHTVWGMYKCSWV